MISYDITHKTHTFNLRFNALDFKKYLHFSEPSSLNYTKSRTTLFFRSDYNLFERIKYCIFRLTSFLMISDCIGRYNLQRS